ncbi:nitrilotriacetate monooxygenase, partial [Enterobacter mori]
LSSLDHLSNGRAGWNIVTSGVSDAAKNFSKTTTMEHDLRYHQADEFLDVTVKLWDSWKNISQSNAEFINTQRPEPINYVGQFYSVKGPLNIEQSPQ